MIAVAAMQATEFVGLPECQLTLAQAVTYLALAPKSNACTTAIAAARRDVREKAVIPVPRHLQDKHYAGAQAARPRRRATSIPTTPQTASRRRTTWASRSATTSRPTAGWNATSRNGSPRSGGGSRQDRPAAP